MSEKKTRAVEKKREALNMKYNAHIFSARDCKRYERGDVKRTIYFKRPNGISVKGSGNESETKP